jgi:hypothetical protein
MIHQQPDEVMKLFGFEYKMVDIVGLVRNINHSSTKITYDVEDFTGSFKFFNILAIYLKTFALQAKFMLTCGLKKGKLQCQQIL